MLGYPNLCQVHDFIRDIEKQNLEGDIVEIGCWKGGCVAFMGWAVKRYGGTRKVHFVHGPRMSKAYPAGWRRMLSLLRALSRTRYRRPR
ncbi:MAG: hypothetical protein GY807_18615 [Gammaproteobacteria bacterium]|nr:hypothetical protein [Gammaproteobacteria bacterium]